MMREAISSKEKRSSDNISNKQITIENWRKIASSKKEEFEQSTNTMLGILENQWNDIKYHSLDRDEYYLLERSPLEILHYCIYDDFLTYPPPEVLWIIAAQFQWYMENEGSVSLEDAFFGKPIKGKGNYSSRVANPKAKLYKGFHRKILGNPELSQSKLLEILCSTHPSEEIHPKYKYAPIFYENKREEIDQDSFLRGYRRWKDSVEADM